MNEHPKSRFPVPAVKDLPEDMQKKLFEFEGQMGFVPNVALVLGHRPDELQAFLAYHDVVMERQSSLSQAEKEMIVLVTSAANQCNYCIMSHGALVRLLSGNPLLADQLAANYKTADITPRQRAMLDFAMKVAVNSSDINDGDFKALAEHGFNDDEIWEIGAITAFFALSNRMASLTKMRPNDEFYSMGR